MSIENSFKTRLRKGDEVIVLTGKNKGTTGKIEKIHTKTHKVTVNGVNLVKKHQKPNVAHPDGGIIDMPMPLHISNVAYLDPKSKKQSKIAYKISENGKDRIAKKSGERIGDN
ncbi:MAG: 50S ribosomal protein L24 [Zetaproteobacteria bacterium]|nr:50S ribosomal protein L24 [Pseudobdellovibrionaceae bacterium]|tara:strand:- start:83 stop:421 length:339 start_codon:yes stop_codon:yes gene_type:complete